MLNFSPKISFGENQYAYKRYAYKKNMYIIVFAYNIRVQPRDKDVGRIISRGANEKKDRKIAKKHEKLHF